MSQHAYLLRAYITQTLNTLCVKLACVYFSSMYVLLVASLLLAVASATPLLLGQRTVASYQRAKRSPHDASLAPGVYVLQFKSRIDSVGLRRVANVLGYEPHDYVLGNGILVHLNSSEQALALQAAIETRLARLVPLLAQDRQDNIGTAVHALSARKGREHFIIYRNGSHTGQPVRHDVVRDPHLVTLRARVIGYDGKTAVAPPAIEACVKDTSRTPVTAEYIGGESNQFVVRNVHCDDAAATADALVRTFSHVAWVEMKTPFKLFNRWGVPTTERGSAVARDSRWRPIATGKGQIVGISDTGVATTQCFFTNGLGSRAGNLPRTSGNSVPRDTGHPKFRAYTSGVGGDFDDSNGHGTHTAGTLAGSAPNNTGAALFNGVASDARLAVYDLLGSEGDGTLAVPDDIGSTILQFFLDCGAYISSHSWGATNGGRYTLDEYSVDMFAWKNRFTLSVWAAGNDGPAKKTIGSPAMCKNCLTVGATMNSIDSYTLAIKRAPYSAAAYSINQSADFSSVGSKDWFPAKPDVLANGGSFRWSAAFDAPKSGSCNSTSESILGLEGTSMATPDVAGACVLIRETLVNTAKLETLPTGSLIRAMIVASAQPTTGIFPLEQYKTVQDRIDKEGFGRVSLIDILDTNYRIVSNERPDLALVRAGDVVRICVSIEGIEPTTGQLPLDLELVISMAYTDYPSTAGVALASLINDLDLVVKTGANGMPLSVNNLAPGTKETRRTMERVIVKPVHAVDISVVARTIDFGGPQTFSLFISLRGRDAKQRHLLISSPQVVHGEQSQPCVVCGKTQFLPKSECVVCGDGTIDGPEQCEPSINGVECCDGTTCRWMPNNSLCATMIGVCRVQGRCSADKSNTTMSCVPSSTMAYSIKRSVSGTLCQSSAMPDNSVVESVALCSHSVAYWVSQLRTNASAYASEDDRICCVRFSAFAERRVPAGEPLYHSLALEYIALRLNAERFASSEHLVLMRATQLALESQCGSVGFTTAADRERATTLIHQLQTIASTNPCADEKIPTDTCTQQPTIRGTEQAELLCSGPPNRFIESERKCACGALFHVGEPDCRDLACSGNGASLFDYTINAPRCVCLPGWAGAQCQRCEEPISGARYLCIGVPKSLVVDHHTHVLQLVASSTLASRLDGTYYAPGVAKEPDALPGQGALDCACRRASARVVPESFETHIETFEAAREDEEEQSILWAHAQVLLHPPPTSSPAQHKGDGARATSSPVKTRVDESSGMSEISLHDFKMLIVIFMIVILV
jgi:subtilisin family serine protease